MELPASSVSTPPPATPLFLCPLCDKPFTKEPQYKRHTAYCSKAKGCTRPRSCRACNQSKIKCGSGNPCHQCVRKGIECVYYVQQPRRKRVQGVKGTEGVVGGAGASEVPGVVAAAVATPNLNSSKLGNEEPGLESGSTDFLDQLNQDHVFGFENSPGVLPSQNSPGNDGAFDIDPAGLYSGESLSITNGSSSKTTFPSFDNFISLPEVSFLHNTPHANDIDWEHYGHDGRHMEMRPFSPSANEADSTPTLRKPVPSPSLDAVLSGHFAKNRIQTPLQQTLATMLIDLLFAYPRMMTRRETFPPFVHANSPASDAETDERKLPGHLINCMGIAQLFTVCNDDTRVFLWSTIRAEMRRFSNRASMFDKYDALSALQASLLYLIMRAGCDAPQQAREDFEMLLTYQAVLRQASELTNHFYVEQGQSSDVRWKDWIFAESGRRIACVWFILGLVFHVRTGAKCWVVDNCRAMPLPCSKTEWEADTESKWRIEHENNAKRSNNKLQTFGDLVEAAHQRLPGGRESESFRIWNAEIDNLGVSLNLAVYMI